LQAAEMFDQGVQQAEVVRALGISRSRSASGSRPGKREPEALQARPTRAALSADRRPARPARAGTATRASRPGYEDRAVDIARIGKLVTKLFGCGTTTATYGC